MSHILITGGTGNLGKTVIETLTKAGHSLHLPVRELDHQALENVSYYQADLTKADQSEGMVASVLEKSSELSAGVFLAGGFISGGLDQISLDSIAKMSTLNFATAFNPAIALIKYFQRNNGGKLIFIGAKAAMKNETAIQNMAYALSKQQLFSFSEMINTSESKHGITAHILLPGTLDTALNRSYMPDADFSKWTNTASLADTINEIIAGRETRTVIAF